MGARMDDKMPCGAPTGVFCLCHNYPVQSNWDLTAGLPAAEPWVRAVIQGGEAPDQDNGPRHLQQQRVQARR